MEKTTKNLKVVLTEQQVLQHGRELARLGAKLVQLESDEKEVRAQYKAEKDAVAARINFEGGLVNNGYEFQDVECAVHFNHPASGEKTIVRLDTYETVAIERMSTREMQMPLFGEDGEEQESAESDTAESVAPDFEEDPAPAYTTDADGNKVRQTPQDDDESAVEATDESRPTTAPRRTRKSKGDESASESSDS